MKSSGSRVPSRKPSALPTPESASLPAARTFDWISSFPGPDELDAFIRGTVTNASIARTCLKEAKETKEALKEAVKKGEAYVELCNERIKMRNRQVAQYQHAVGVLRSKATR